MIRERNLCIMRSFKIIIIIIIIIYKYFYDTQNKDDSVGYADRVGEATKLKLNVRLKF